MVDDEPTVRRALERLLSAAGQNRRFGEILLWDTATGQLQLTLHAYKHWVESLRLSPDAKLLASERRAQAESTTGAGAHEHGCGTHGSRTAS